MITESIFTSAQTFDEFYQNIQELYANGKATGDNQNQAFLDYTKLGIQRIKRGLKTVSVKGDITHQIKTTKAVNWLVITEGWCGDGANILPYIIKLTKHNRNINLKIILRDDNPQIMENYLTNGSKSIPIIILLDNQFNELAIWGPRPKPAQDMVLENKTRPVMSSHDFKIALQKWYIKDKHTTIEKEFEEILAKL